MIKRFIEHKIKAALKDTPVVLLHGARQTGKTTLAKSIISRRNGSAYLTLDDLSTLSSALGDPTAFVRNLPRYVVIDEVQKAPELFPVIKQEVDNDRLPGRFLLTGSANVMLLPKLSESLAGRMEIVSLYPLSRGELLRKRETIVDWLLDPRTLSPGVTSAAASAASKDIASGAEAIQMTLLGGYPEAVERKAPGRRTAWFASYLSTILQRDIRDLAQIEGLIHFPKILALLASRNAGLLNVAEIGRAAGLSATTFQRYLALLEAVFLLFRLPAWAPGIEKRVVKAPKLHFCDSGLACHLAGASKQRLLADRTLFGHLLETFVVMELKKQCSFADQPAGLFHFRASGGAEVDLVLENSNGQVAGVEIKASETIGTRDFSGLRSFAETAGKRFLKGIIIYCGRETLPFGKSLWALPIGKLWR
jgi:uncharacterized protein